MPALPSAIPLFRIVLTPVLAMLCGLAFASPADEKLEALMDQVWQAEMAASPLMASRFGSGENRDKVDDLSEAEVQASGHL